MKYKRIQGVAHNLGHSFLSDAKCASPFFGRAT
jgi:hypothetical protein